MGRICVSHQFNTASRFGTYAHWKIQSSHLYRVFNCKFYMPPKTQLIFHFVKVYCLGTLLSMQIPFVGFQPVQSSEHMAAFGVFGLCQLYAFNEYLKSKLSKEYYDILFRSVVLLIGITALTAGIALSVIGSEFEIYLRILLI